MTTPDIVPLSEASDLLHTPANTLRWWRQQDRGPKSFKLGRRVMYRKSDIEAYLDEAYAKTAK